MHFLSLVCIGCPAKSRLGVDVLGARDLILGAGNYDWLNIFCPAEFDPLTTMLWFYSVVVMPYPEHLLSIVWMYVLKWVIELRWEYQNRVVLEMLSNTKSVVWMCLIFVVTC
jgi:hypothetical protein